MFCGEIAHHFKSLKKAFRLFLCKKKLFSYGRFEKGVSFLAKIFSDVSTAVGLAGAQSGICKGKGL